MNESTKPQRSTQCNSRLSSRDPGGSNASPPAIYRENNPYQKKNISQDAFSVCETAFSVTRLAPPFASVMTKSVSNMSPEEP